MHSCRFAAALLIAALRLPLDAHAQEPAAAARPESARAFDTAASRFVPPAHQARSPGAGRAASPAADPGSRRHAC
jgi:hypothetical protein